MIDSFDMDKGYRNAYLRYVLNLLKDKYYVNQSAISKACGIYTKNLNDFARGVRDFGKMNLDKLEAFLIDLYGGLLEYEVPQSKREFTNFVKSL